MGQLYPTVQEPEREKDPQTKSHSSKKTPYKDSYLHHPPPKKKKRNLTGWMLPFSIPSICKKRCLIKLNCVPTTLMINESPPGNPIESSKVESDTSNTRSLRGGGRDRKSPTFPKSNMDTPKKSWFGKGDSFQNMGHELKNLSMWNFWGVKKIHTKKGCCFWGVGANLPNLPTTTSTVGVHLKGVFEFLGHLQEPGWIWWIWWMNGWMDEWMNGWMDGYDGYDATKKTSQSLQIWKKKTF